MASAGTGYLLQALHGFSVVSWPDGDCQDPDFSVGTIFAEVMFAGRKAGESGLTALGEEARTVEVADLLERTVRPGDMAGAELARLLHVPMATIGGGDDQRSGVFAAIDSAHVFGDHPILSVLEPDERILDHVPFGE